MPQVEMWSRLPISIRDHLIERMRDRHISLADLNQLRLWVETKPEGPEGPWTKISAHSNFVAKVDFPRRS
jgi:hypothetical protein